MKVFFSGLLLLVIVTSCNSKKTSYTQEQLYEKFASGVVLIQNTYYYRISLSDGSFYSTTYNFSGIDDGELKNLSLETHREFDKVADSIKSRMFGTGFFISSRGTIVTNSHVINPSIEKELIYKSLTAKLKEEIDRYSQLIDLEYRDLAIIENGLRTNNNVSSDHYQMLFNGAKSCNKSIKLYTENRDFLLKKITLQNYKVELCSEIKIAYNGSRITSSSNLVDCFVVKDVPNYDLGIIQIANGTGFWNVCKMGSAPMWDYEQENITGWNTVQNAGSISLFKLPEDKYVFNPFSEMTANSEENKLYMIGFNQGLDLALTSEGIKAQITQGNISQNTDSIQIMYSIPTLQGSSGSPVVNQYGELIAINFAGIGETQGFNYGIKVERLREIINDEAVVKCMKVYEENPNTKTNSDSLDMIEEVIVE